MEERNKGREREEKWMMRGRKDILRETKGRRKKVEVKKLKPD